MGYARRIRREKIVQGYVEDTSPSLTTKIGILTIIVFMALVVFL
jgi:hypothetical protein